jgi:hypothetical protein
MEGVGTPSLPRAAMKGSGFYNDNSNLQAAIVDVSGALLSRLAREVPLPGAGAALQVAEFGASTGGNSVAPVLRLARGLAARIARPLDVVITHEVRRRAGVAGPRQLPPPQAATPRRWPQGSCRAGRRHTMACMDARAR